LKAKGGMMLLSHHSPKKGGENEKQLNTCEGGYISSRI